MADCGVRSSSPLIPAVLCDFFTRLPQTAFELCKPLGVRVKHLQQIRKQVVQWRRPHRESSGSMERDESCRSAGRADCLHLVAEANYVVLLSFLLSRFRLSSSASSFALRPSFILSKLFCILFARSSHSFSMNREISATEKMKALTTLIELSAVSKYYVLNFASFRPSERSLAAVIFAPASINVSRQSLI
jgi:hypothetical protein